MPDSYGSSQESADSEGKEKEAEYKPTDAQKERIKFVYDEREEMLKKRQQTYPQFNDRTLQEFIDDSEKRLNAYVLSKEEQGKEDWQSNFATRAYANKAKALLAATARDLPDMRFAAVNDEDQFHHFAADISKNLVRHSYNQGNPQEEMFFLSWSNCGHGTVLSYEGMEKQVYIKKRIKSYDVATGDVEEEEVEKISEGEPVSYELRLTDVLIKNFYIRDVQEQPGIIIEEYYADEDRFKTVYGRFPNATKVKNLSDIKENENDTFFHERWKESCKDGRGYYVCRYMNKYKNGGSGSYRIIANGVELFNGPMIWMDVTRKGLGRRVYPIAKTIYEPFANPDFFYGNSLPNSAMGEGDVLNTLYNSALDKHYRSMVPPLLVGNVNKDMLDLEDEVVAGDTKIYVDDINQVKQMDIKGISSADIQMIQLIANGLDLTTLDPSQSGAAQRYITARAAVAADEKAKQLKGVFFMFMESLWLQKTRLRIANILLTYTRPKYRTVLGEEGAERIITLNRTFNVKGAQLSDGSRGTLAVGMTSREDLQANRGKYETDIEAEESRNKKAGMNYEKVYIPYDYLDRYSYDVEIIPETLWQSSAATNMAKITEKIGMIRTAFPEYFAANKQTLFTDFLKAYGDDPNRYELPPTMDFSEEQGLEIAKGVAGRGGAGGGAGPGRPQSPEALAAALAGGGE